MREGIEKAAMPCQKDGVLFSLQEPGEAWSGG